MSTDNKKDCVSVIVQHEQAVYLKSHGSKEDSPNTKNKQDNRVGTETNAISSVTESALATVNLPVALTIMSLVQKKRDDADSDSDSECSEWSDICGPCPSLGLPVTCYTLDTVINDVIAGSKYTVRDKVEGRVDMYVTMRH